jgi:hypothetical protein
LVNNLGVVLVKVGHGWISKLMILKWIQ